MQQHQRQIELATAFDPRSKPSPSGRGCRTAFRQVTTSAGCFEHLLVFPVVSYPAWLSESISSGPAEKSLLWLTPTGRLCFGIVVDNNGWVRDERWELLIGSAKQQSGVSLAKLRQSAQWRVDAFRRDRSFRFAFGESGYRDPWRQLRRAIAELISVVVARLHERASEVLRLEELSYLLEAADDDMQRNRRQALALMPHPSMRMKLASHPATAWEQVRFAVDHGEPLRARLAEALGCSVPAARFLMGSALAISAIDMRTIEFVSALVEFLPRKHWPRNYMECRGLGALIATAASELDLPTDSRVVHQLLVASWAHDLPIADRIAIGVRRARWLAAVRLVPAHSVNPVLDVNERAQRDAVCHFIMQLSPRAMTAMAERVRAAEDAAVIARAATWSRLAIWPLPERFEYSGFIVRTLRTWADTKRWGIRAGNCLRSPLPVLTYLARGCVLLSIQEEKADLCRLATAAVSIGLDGSDQIVWSIFEASAAGNSRLDDDLREAVEHAARSIAGRVGANHVRGFRDAAKADMELLAQARQGEANFEALLAQRVAAHLCLDIDSGLLQAGARLPSNGPGEWHQ